MRPMRDVVEGVGEQGDGQALRQQPHPDGAPAKVPRAQRRLHHQSSQSIN